jgi:hypothetical protein
VQWIFPAVALGPDPKSKHIGHILIGHPKHVLSRFERQRASLCQTVATGLYVDGFTIIGTFRHEHMIGAFFGFQELTSGLGEDNHRRLIARRLCAGNQNIRPEKYRHGQN